MSFSPLDPRSGQGPAAGKQPKLSALQRRHLVVLHTQGEFKQAELTELFGVTRSTIYRTIQRETIEPTA